MPLLRRRVALNELQCIGQVPCLPENLKKSEIRRWLKFRIHATRRERSISCAKWNANLPRFLCRVTKVNDYPLLVGLVAA